MILEFCFFSGAKFEKGHAIHGRKEEAKDFLDFINMNLNMNRNRICPESSATGMGQFPICKLKWDLLWTSATACTINKNTFSPPFGIFYVKTEI